MKKKILFIILTFTISVVVFLIVKNKGNGQLQIPKLVLKKEKKTLEQRALFVKERLMHEYKMQANPETGEIPTKEKRQEFLQSITDKKFAKANRTVEATSFISRGPTNLGGRTRAVVIDVSDPTSNTMIAGGVSSGVFRTTNGGLSWSKVSPNDEIHNVTDIAQDPRPGFQNIWYYATGEGLGNSASLSGAFFFGRGVWRSVDNGVTWNQISATNSVFESFDNRLDIITAIAVNPTNGHLMIAATNRIYRYDGTSLIAEITGTGGTNTGTLTDVVITNTGRVYAAFHGGQPENGIWTSPTGTAPWTRIAQNGTPTNWSSTGRLVLGLAPSNNNILYALYRNGDDSENGAVESDLWQYNSLTNTWTNYTSKLPDEPGGNSVGNDPFSIQGGYDLVVEVKPDNSNFVLIGGTNAYKIEDIVNDATFTRIGGYLNNGGYSTYNIGGVNHHPDIHSFTFDPNNSSVVFTGTDGGIHKTLNVSAASVEWVNLNNNYVTYQYYHVALDPTTGSDIVLGGAQDNGTTIGGLSAGLPNNSDMNSVAGGDGVAVGLAKRNGGAALQMYLGFQNGSIYTNPPGSGFSEITPSGSDSQFVTYYYLDPDNTDNLYYAGKGVLYRTTDAENVTSGSWTNLGSPIGFGITNSDEWFQTFSTSRGVYNANTSYLLMGGDTGSILRLDNPANVSNLSSVVDITPPGVTSGTVTGLAVHPTNRDIVLATYSNYGITNIFLTNNATATSPTWSIVERNLNAHSIRSAAITEVNGSTVYYVGTARGLYASEDPTSENWTLQGVNEIGQPIVSSLVYRPSDNKLLIGTHGNGMFEATASGTLSVDGYTKNSLNASIYPNPVTSRIQVVSDKFDLSANVKYRIYDLSGKELMSGEFTNKSLDVSNLPTGIYVLSMKVDRLTQTIKFIKN